MHAVGSLSTSLLSPLIRASVWPGGRGASLVPGDAGRGWHARRVVARDGGYGLRGLVEGLLDDRLRRELNREQCVAGAVAHQARATCA